tara:strand:+ start:631 stop:1014 length:384 start_codon:yes stop_codon:yes gene_type:complete
MNKEKNINDACNDISARVGSDNIHTIETNFRTEVEEIILADEAVCTDIASRDEVTYVDSNTAGKIRANYENLGEQVSKNFSEYRKLFYETQKLKKSLLATRALVNAQTKAIKELLTILGGNNDNKKN